MSDKKTFKEKLFGLQSTVGRISKDSDNPFFRSKYFDINSLVGHLNPILKENRLVLLQPVRGNVVYSEIHDVDSDEKVDSYMEMTDIKDPQKKGSEVTYYRRYTLASLLGLQAEDDDANAASSAKKVDSKDDGKKWLNIGTKEWENVIEKKPPMIDIEAYYKMTKETKAALIKALK